jgi:hypothetical protein
LVWQTKYINKKDKSIPSVHAATMLCSSTPADNRQPTSQAGPQQPASQPNIKHNTASKTLPSGDSSRQHSQTTLRVLLQVFNLYEPLPLQPLHLPYAVVQLQAGDAVQQTAAPGTCHLLLVLAPFAAAA